jgi:hypothetical protein
MDGDRLTTDEIHRLSAQIDQELRELAQAPPAVAFRGLGSGETPLSFPTKQLEAIEAATGEAAESFWSRFKGAARKDLCEEGGQLYYQWQKWGDLSNDRLILFTYGVLLGMGFKGAIVYVLIVAVVVTILSVGLKAFCAQGG